MQPAEMLVDMNSYIMNVSFLVANECRFLGLDYSLAPFIPFTKVQYIILGFCLFSEWFQHDTSAGLIYLKDQNTSNESRRSPALHNQNIFSV